jgi:hypothetical protein
VGEAGINPWFNVYVKSDSPVPIDENGGFRISHLRPGSYLLRLSIPPFSGYSTNAAEGHVGHPTRQRRDERGCTWGVDGWTHDSRARRAHERSENADAAESRDEGALTFCPAAGSGSSSLSTPPPAQTAVRSKDCPVCCNPNVIHVEFFPDPDPDPPRVCAEAE